MMKKVLLSLFVIFCLATVSDVFSKPLICIDPGHGGKDPGSTHTIDGITLKEKDVNLDVAQHANSYLKKWGYQTVMTRDTDKFVDLTKRADIANEKGADAFVSIHHNAANNERADGVESFAKTDGKGKYHTSSYYLAAWNSTVLHWGITSYWDPSQPNPSKYEKRGDANGVKQDSDLPAGARDMIRKVKSASALVECAFLSNPYRHKQLRNSNYKQMEGLLVAYGTDLWNANRSKYGY